MNKPESQLELGFDAASLSTAPSLEGADSVAPPTATVAGPAKAATPGAGIITTPCPDPLPAGARWREFQTE